MATGSIPVPLFARPPAQYSQSYMADITRSFALYTNILSSQAPKLSWGNVPATAAAAGVAGDVAYDADYIYVCVSDSTWKRVAIATW